MADILHKTSPKYYVTKLHNPTFDDIVDVYEDRVNGWLIEPAKIINSYEHSGLSVLHIIFAYFEGHAAFYHGIDTNNQSNKCFRRAFKVVFPQISSHPLVDQIMDILWFDGRNGLAHIGFPRRRIVLQDGDPVFRFEVNENNDKIIRVHIDRNKIVQGVEEHLVRYIARLRDPQEKVLRDNFITAWNIIHK